MHRFETRLSRLEQQAAERAKPGICNCRGETQYHNANCLDGLLKRMPRVCPLHSFRDLGFLKSLPSCFPLTSEDNQFCPCPPDPWRALNLSKDTHTKEEKFEAIRASLRIPRPDQSSSLYDSVMAEVVQDSYWKARQQWIEKTGRQLPSRDELAKLSLERWSEFVNKLKKSYV